jgi:RsiW-degrading membrane proteinase PrsW (M82 family)
LYVQWGYSLKKYVPAKSCIVKANVYQRSYPGSNRRRRPVYPLSDPAESRLQRAAQNHHVGDRFGRDRHCGQLLLRLSTAATLHNSLLVGLIEEGTKSLPLAFLIYSRKYFNKITDGIVYFGIAGMIFGLIENIEYSLTLGEAAGIGKVITGPYVHAGFAVLIGWTLARQKVLHRGWWLVIAGFIASLGLHGLYDFGLIYGSGWTVLMSLAITLAININIFILLKDAQKEDGKLGLAAVGVNYYCRNCGAPNPERFLYCLQCGKKT